MRREIVMANDSFTRSMKLSKKDSETLLKLLETDIMVCHKVTPPPVEEASEEDENNKNKQEKSIKYIG